MDIKAALSHLKIDLKSIQDENLRGCIILLLNAVEQLSKENAELRTENQRLRDEINRLKGEQGKPDIRPQKSNKDISSESERKNDNSDDSDQDKPKRTKPKKEDIKIDRVLRCDISKDELPPDAEFKGYEDVVVQGIKITTDNIKFERAAYYSPSQGKTYLAPLPPGYHGQFSPEIKALVMDLYQDGGMTEPAIERFFKTHGVYISSGKISNIITDDVAPLHQEKKDIVDAGLLSTNYQHLDDTGARVNGKNHHTHILCNPFFTAFTTLPTRDRLAAIEVLSNGDLKFCINEATYTLMQTLGLSEKRLTQLKALQLKPILMSREEIDAHIKSIFPKEHRHLTSQKIIREAAAIVAYQQYNSSKAPILLTDGAFQFQLITEHHALCWIHEGRHYKKLSPVLHMHHAALLTFRQSFWDFYRQLIAFKKAPNEKEVTRLSSAFDELFSRKTDYQDLDDRIVSTLAKKEKLLLVLRFPNLPLHNNPAELGARVQARKRDISMQTKNPKGTKSKDSLMTVTETAKKLLVNTYQYFCDRLSGKHEMPSLADLIRQRSSPILDG
jgi:regulator of replication initiation timing